MGLNRRAFLAGASAAAVAAALPAIAAPAPERISITGSTGPITSFGLGHNPVRAMQAMMMAMGFEIDFDSFDDLAAHCEQTVTCTRDPEPQTNAAFIPYDDTPPPRWLLEWPTRYRDSALPA